MLIRRAGRVKVALTYEEVVLTYKGGRINVCFRRAGGFSEAVERSPVLFETVAGFSKIGGCHVGLLPEGCVKG
jgi:hypothetical protein